MRNVVPVYGVTGLTEEIMAHLVECRVKRAVLLLDADDAGRAAAIDMAQRLAAVNIETRPVELPAKDAAEFTAGGGLVDELRMLITGAESSSADASAAREVRAEASGTAAFAERWCSWNSSEDGYHPH
ncbi:MAG TPA: toprim domain-containing protein [Pyrinomonadaceae bacterium]